MHKPQITEIADYITGMLEANLKDDNVYILVRVSYDYTAKQNVDFAGNKTQIMSYVACDMDKYARIVDYNVMMDTPKEIEPIKFYNFTDRLISMSSNVTEDDYHETDKTLYGNSRIAIIDTGIKHKGE